MMVGKDSPTNMSENSSSSSSEGEFDEESIISFEVDDDRSQSTGISPHERHVDEEQNHIARKEMYAVLCSKVTVYIVLFLAAASVGSVTWFLTTNDEKSSFESEFRLFANDLIKASESNVEAMFGATETFAIASTSFAKENNVSWPFVTVPDWERRSNHARLTTGLELVSLHPLITSETRAEYESYSVQETTWLQEGLAIQEREVANPGEGVTPVIFRPQAEEGQPDFFFPTHQLGPAPDKPSILNLDLLTWGFFRNAVFDMLLSGRAVLSKIEPASVYYEMSYSWYKDSLTSEYWDAANSKNGNAEHDHKRSLQQAGEVYLPEEERHSFIIQPVYDTFGEGAKIAALVLGIIPWQYYFLNVLPNGVNGFIVNLKDNCGTQVTYRINGEDVQFLGVGDMHDPAFDYLAIHHNFAVFNTLLDNHDYKDNADDDLDFDHNNANHCSYSLHVYPSKQLERTYFSNKPAIYTSVVVLVFFFTAMVFIVYDYLVTRRQSVVLSAAARTQALVSSLFPKSVQQRILEDANEQAALNNNASNNRYGFRAKSQLKEFLEEDGDHAAANTPLFGSRPIADLFPECTVLFADIAGFTAWSSTREPSQVFTLLETIYHEFDTIAKRRRVFKVETVGDCYVAVAGLPEPRKDHAVVMARFARDCMNRMNALTKKLEISLGPDTTELTMRFGLHSGPVTAGVLRGERARFQLFGDTVNTASRMESTGKRDCIQISQETADLLVGAGKQHWITPREDKVHAKGKGELQTYWLDVGSELPKTASVAVSSETNSDDIKLSQLQSSMNASARSHSIMKDVVAEQVEIKTLEAKQQRLIDWNTALLMKQLRLIVAQRENMHTRPDPLDAIHYLEHGKSRVGGTVLDEVVEIVNLPRFSEEACVGNKDPDSIEMDSQVEVQLRDYVQTIAAMYRNNPFHNFEHASHVTMSSVKLLSRIVAPDLDKLGGNDTLKCLHDHTYGITSDPLTQFSVIFSALIHDVDHKGVPNTTLIKEKASIASVYKGKSVAEQNSVDIAWDLLMDDSYQNLRQAIYQTAPEYRRFRQLVVNAVLATDIMDKDLGAQRKARWNKAFAEGALQQENGEQLVNRKATIVIEHLIQASDVAHTMQHWHIYTKWNERLFEELYVAFKDGRADKNPADNWYQGEIGFYDFYIIPLAMKLRSCGVFGVSSDEYLSYAQQNRHEWELKGKEFVANMLEKYERKYHTPQQ